MNHLQNVGSVLPPPDGPGWGATKDPHGRCQVCGPDAGVAESSSLPELPP